MAEQNVNVMFAQAQEELRSTGRYRYTAKGGEQVYSRKYEDILAIYEKRMSQFKYDMPVRNIWESIGHASQEELDSILAARRTIPQLSMMEEMGARATYLKAEAKLWWTHRSPAAKMALGVTAVAGLAYALTPDRNDVSSDRATFNTIEGLKDRGNAGSIRQLMTDFGSGWRGLIGLPRAFMGRVFPELGNLAAGGAEAFYMKQEGIRIMLRESKAMLRSSQLAKAGKTIGFELSDRDTELAIRAIRQLQDTVHREKGAKIVWDEVIAEKPISYLKNMLRHEDLHEASEFGKSVRELVHSKSAPIIRPSTQPFDLLNKEVGRFEFMRMMNVVPLPIASSIETREILRTHEFWDVVKGSQRAELEAAVREEYFAYQFGDLFSGGVRPFPVGSFLQEQGQGAPPSFMKELVREEKAYRLQTLKEDRARKLATEADRIERMTMNKSKRYAPGGLKRVRDFSSPHLVNPVGEGMVQRQFKTRKGSERMYQP